jgi:hypothetical protein
VNLFFIWGSFSGFLAGVLAHHHSRYKTYSFRGEPPYRQLEYENSKLKKLVADLSLDIVMLKDVNSKKW